MSKKEVVEVNVKTFAPLFHIDFKRFNKKSYAREK